MFDLIEGLVGLDSDLFEAHPDEDGASDMVTDDAGLAALAAFNSSELLGFAVKLLNFPAPATRLLCGLRVILSEVVGDDIVRALGRQHHPEQFHLVFFGKAFEFDPLAVCNPYMLSVNSRNTQRIAAFCAEIVAIQIPTHAESPLGVGTDDKYTRHDHCVATSRAKHLLEIIYHG